MLLDWLLWEVQMAGWVVLMELLEVQMVSILFSINYPHITPTYTLSPLYTTVVSILFSIIPILHQYIPITPIYYSSFHFISHYPNIAPI